MAVVSLLDCCLLAASLSRACSFSSTTNRSFLEDFVANNFVPGENCCECLRTELALSEVTVSFETLTFTSWLTAVETNLYVSTRFRIPFSHTDCKLLVTMMETQCSIAIPTNFNLSAITSPNLSFLRLGLKLFRFEI